MKHECVEERNRDKIGECNSFYSPFNAMCMYLCWLCMHLSRSECWKSSSNSFTTSRTQIKSERIKLRCHTSISSEVYVKCWCKIHTCNFSLEVDILKIVFLQFKYTFIWLYIQGQYLMENKLYSYYCYLKCIRLIKPNSLMDIHQ